MKDEKPATMEQTVPHLSQKIEIMESLPVALIASNEVVVGALLAQQLLELPLKVIVLAQGEADAVKHLISNERFRLAQEAELPNLWKADPSPISYIFDIRQEKKEETPATEALQQEAMLLRLARENHTKYELILITNPDAVSDTNNGEGIIGASFERTLQKAGLENLRIIKIVDLYGPRMPLTSAGELDRFFRRIGQRELEVAGEGLIPLYPLYITDAVTAIIKAMFCESTKGKTLVVGGEKDITMLNLAYKLREVYFLQTDQLLEIKFLKDRQPATRENAFLKRRWLKDKIDQTQSILEWKPTTELEEGIAKTLQVLYRGPKTASEASLENLKGSSKQPMEERRTPQSQEKPREKPAQQVIQRTRWKALILILMLMFVVPPLTLAGRFGVGTLILAQAARDVKATNFTNSQRMAERAAEQFEITQQEFLLITSLFPNWINKTVFIQEAETVLTTSKLLAQALLNLGRTGSHVIQAKEIMLGKANDSLEEEVANINAELKELFQNLSLIETMLDSNREERQGIKQESLWEMSGNAKTEIKRKKTLITATQNLVNLLEKLLIKKEKQTYLVLLQNNAELRPTGGFIGSYALVGFHNGKLADFTVEDVYVADGQLKGHVEPPLPIKKYLGEAGWYLRDANWDADFPTSARQIEWFFEKETGRKVDGTIAVNLYVVQEILRAIGPIELDDYQEIITAENLFRIAESYSELNSFPGTTQKTDFLGSLVRSLFIKFEAASPKTLIEVTSALRNSLEKGQLLIAAHDEAAQKTLHALAWDGSLREVSCEGGEEDLPCLGNFFAIREANVGVNKANYFVSRAIALSQKLLPEQTQTTLTVRYQNQSPAETWPGGTYKNYFRMYFAKGGEVVSVKVDGKELESARVELGAEHGKIVIGFLVAIPIQQEKTVEITINSDPLQFKDGKTKEILVLQKQPGTQDDPLTIQLILETGITVQNTNIPLTIDEQTATFSQNFSSDVSLAVEFKRAQ